MLKHILARNMFLTKKMRFRPAKQLKKNEQLKKNRIKHTILGDKK